MERAIESIDHLVEPLWDVVVIGTGMGGATLGYALARSGKRVLFCERGASNLDGGGLRGAYAETRMGRGSDSSTISTNNALRNAGRQHAIIADVSAPKPTYFVPFMGDGVGGSSALYGMALERLFPSDFEAGPRHDAAERSAEPSNWPFSYEELEPHYRHAESLYGVSGDRDPLRKDPVFGYVRRAPEYTSGGGELAGFLEKKGLHPYHLPLACNYLPGCEGCQGYLCSKPCKNDSVTACLEPALNQFGASLLNDFEVLSLEADARGVTGVSGRWKGKVYRVRGKVIALAAGALATPGLLLRSASPEWPSGLANASDLVGRNLMRHYIDLYAVFTRKRPSVASNLKEIGFNDLYETPNGTLGSVQSFGPMPPGPVLVDSIEEELRAKSLVIPAALFRPIKPLLGWILDRVFSRATILASITEDTPSRDNRVSECEFPETTTRTLAFRYIIGEQDRLRIVEMRQSMRRILKGYFYLHLKQAENNQRLAHVCGTCRSGIDPVSSVVDRNCRAHGIDNLYIVDASIFPTSGGTNPSLTVAANALRVADHIAASQLLDPDQPIEPGG